jgi:hypothetical protein
VLRRLLAVTAVLIALIAGNVPAVNAAVPTGGDCFKGLCSVDTTIPGGGGGQPGGGGGGNPGGPGAIVVQPGPTTCKKGDVEIECTTSQGVWSNADQCYWQLAPNQATPPPGESADRGAWYKCEVPCAMGPGLCGVTTRWQGQPPAGVNQLTPAQAAGQLFRQFVFQGVSIGIVPKDQPGYQGSVGLPVWMWVNNPSQESYGPWMQSGTFGGIAVTGTAKVTSIDWNMGDGNVVSCANPGTPYVTAYALQPSATCGYVYQKMSKNQPGGKYPVTATSHWEFRWTAAGQTGTNNTTVQSVTQLDIGELQSVNVKNPGQG